MVATRIIVNMYFGVPVGSSLITSEGRSRANTELIEVRV